jgi:glycosyltransferase involved in cell wall biosynthesis
MAAGVPSVASDIPALREVGGDTVRYAPIDVASGLAEAIRRTLDRSEESAAMARRARERARRFSWELCASETLAIYRAVMEQPRRPARR